MKKSIIALAAFSWIATETNGAEQYNPSNYNGGNPTEKASGHLSDTTTEDSKFSAQFKDYINSTLKNFEPIRQKHMDMIHGGVSSSTMGFKPEYPVTEVDAKLLEIKSNLQQISDILNKF